VRLVLIRELGGPDLVASELLQRLPDRLGNDGVDLVNQHPFVLELGLVLEQDGPHEVDDPEYILN